MSTIYEDALAAHLRWRGKVGVDLKVPLSSMEELSLAYTPGVAEPCRKIRDNVENARLYTWKGNSVAVVSDGSAVLGLGNIGAYAALPVMEGKCALFKRFAGIDAVPLCVSATQTEEIIEFCKRIEPTFGAICLEDISAPRCVEIERALDGTLGIPVFHDDQHGTAIVVTAALMNAFKLAGKRVEDVTVTVSGTGAAGSAIIKMLNRLGVPRIYGFNINGIVLRSDSESYDFLTRELAAITNPDDERLTLEQAMERSDAFVGVSAPNIVSERMVKSMKKDAVVFAMANPEPEITYSKAKSAGALVAGTGRSDCPNQINNVLAFPGVFRGALDSRAAKITDSMKLAAAQGLASLIPSNALNPENIIPTVFDERVVKVVSNAVALKAQNLPPSNN